MVSEKDIGRKVRTRATGKRGWLLGFFPNDPDYAVIHLAQCAQQRDASALYTARAKSVEVADNDAEFGPELLAQLGRELEGIGARLKNLSRGAR